MARAASSGATVLDAETCLELLRSHKVGRITLCVARHTETFPVPYVLNDDTVVFCTVETTTLAPQMPVGEVAFEVDGRDEDSDDKWSVRVKGHTEEVAVYSALDPDTYPLFPWSAGVRTHFIRLRPEAITGRRFHASHMQPTKGGQGRGRPPAA